MTDYEKFIEEALQKKIEDGSLDKLLGEYVEGAIKKSLQELFNFSYNGNHGDGYKLIESKIKPLIIKAIDDCDYSLTAEKTKVALNELIKQCSIAQTGKAIEKALGIFNDMTNVAYGQEMSLKDIFSKYCEYVKHDLGKDFIDEYDLEVEDNYASARLCCSVEELESSSWTYETTKSVKMFIQEEDDNECNDHCVAFLLRKDYRGRWIIDFGKSPLGLAEIRRLDSFAMHLYDLSMHWCNVIDVRDYDEDIEINAYE